MRKTALLLAGLLVVSSAAFAATAATGATGDKGTTAATGSMDKGMDKGMAKAKADHFNGEVTKVDDATKKFSVKGAKDVEKEFTWDDKTVMSPKDAKVEVGGKVSVTSKDGVASKITVHKAKAAKAKKS